jgi:hypothetical protein
MTEAEAAAWTMQAAEELRSLPLPQPWSAAKPVGLSPWPVWRDSMTAAVHSAGKACLMKPMVGVPRRPLAERREPDARTGQGHTPWRKP